MYKLSIIIPLFNEQHRLSNNLTILEKILKKLGIELGFKEIMTIKPKKGMKKINNSSLEIARQDHSHIMKMMNLSN